MQLSRRFSMHRLPFLHRRNRIVRVLPSVEIQPVFFEGIFSIRSRVLITRSSSLRFIIRTQPGFNPVGLSWAASISNDPSSCGQITKRTRAHSVGT